jgi:ketosteroid isomerase-like protein
MLLRGLALAVLVSFAACGDAPTPDRERIETLVDDFFKAAADKDAEAVCAVLTEDGWAHAVQRRFEVDEPLRSADEDDCVRLRAPAALRSDDLPGMMQYGYRPHLERLRILGDRASGVVRLHFLKARWAFRKLDGEWKIESFDLPVRE